MNFKKILNFYFHFNFCFYLHFFTLLSVSLPLFLFYSCGDSKEEEFSAELASSLILADPLYEHAWHLESRGQAHFAENASLIDTSINVTSTWEKGYKGKGIKIFISDTGIESTHEDLRENFSAKISRNYNCIDQSGKACIVSGIPVPYAKNHHGTSVAGLASARDFNGVGIRGVAPRAFLAGNNYLDSAVSNLWASKSPSLEIDELSRSVDIINQSHGHPQSLLYPISEAYERQLNYAATKLRGGKGIIVVRAAGNSYNQATYLNTVRVANANFDSYMTNPYKIIVGAYNSQDKASSYSTPGANLWISSPGGEFGDLYPAIISTDLSGCEYGQAISSSANEFNRGNLGNTKCSYTMTMNGTSAAAPIVSGAVALLLEANPKLTLRDVKHILAMTALQIDPQSLKEENPRMASPTGHIWEEGWTVNAAGYYFHNRYGFGKLNIDAAIEMARNNYTSLAKRKPDIAYDSGPVFQKDPIRSWIPDNAVQGVSHSIPIVENRIVENVQITVDVVHDNIGEVGIELTSPSGTKSIIVPINNSLEGRADFKSARFLSNAFYGELSRGLWTIKVIDGKYNDRGRFVRWSIRIINR